MLKSTPLFQNSLPQSSFLPFQAKKLRSPKIVWLNHSLLAKMGYELGSAEEILQVKDSLINQYAFMVPNSDEINKPELENHKSKIFLAEYYGTQGELANGGGVRCGAEGDFQVKGIGRNPLAGKHMDYWHTYGGASLAESFRDALWGEILNSENTYGAVRIAAIIATGSTTPFEYWDGDDTIREEPLGALMLRELSIRPAHFERAIFFTPLQHEEMQAYSDATRVKNAIPMIGKSLPDLGVDATIEKQLKELVLRYAKHAAEMKARKLTHGALTTGNVEITGKLIDFGTTTALPDYANYLIQPQFPPFWADHMQYIGIIRTLTFYINKYHPETSKSKDKKINTQELIDYFDLHIRVEIKASFLEQIGFPNIFCKEISSLKSTTEFSDRVINLAKSCAKNTFNFHVIDKEKTYAEHDMKSIFGLLSSYGEHIQEYHFNNIIKDEETRKSFIDSFKGCLDEYYSFCFNENIDREAALHLLKVNYKIRNKPLKAAYRDVISTLDDIEQLSQSQNTKTPSLESYMNKKLSQSRRFSLNIDPWDALLSVQVFNNLNLELLQLFNAKNNEYFIEFQFFCSQKKPTVNAMSLVLDIEKSNLIRRNDYVSLRLSKSDFNKNTPFTAVDEEGRMIHLNIFDWATKHNIEIS